MTTSSLLESLLPTKRGAVMDLVQEAGIDVTPWYTRKNGAPVKTPRANPKFCYDWSFGGGDEPLALCIWHKSLVAQGDTVICDENLRAFAIKLEARDNDPSSSSEVKSRARSQAQRARKFDQHLAVAFQLGSPIRAIILRGKVGIKKPPGDSASVVEFRLLDQEKWHVASYKSDGSFRLVRGLSNVDKPIYVDQFDVMAPASRVESSGSVFLRSHEVRSRVLDRSNGHCEHCGTPGFMTKNGGIYLETHHVIPLSEGGADHVGNVVAICADDHRRAHHSINRDSIRESLLAKLRQIQP